MNLLDPGTLARLTPQNAEAFFYAHYDHAIPILCPDYVEMMQTLVDTIPADTRKVVDLGCGTGTLLHRLAASRPEIVSLVGIDRDATLLDEARYKLRLCPQVVLLQGDLRRFPLPPAEVMVSSLLLHNLTPDEQAALYARLACVTRCFLLFDAVAGDSPAEEAERWSYLRWWLGEQGLPAPVQDLAITHIRSHDCPLSLSQHRQAAERAGMKVTTVTVAPGFAVLRATADAPLN